MNRHERVEPNIYKRHRKSCKWMATGKCNCTPAYEARIYSAGRSADHTARTLAEARIWLNDKRKALARGYGLPTRVTVKEAAESFIDAMEKGEVLNKHGKPYKPSVIRSYRRVLRKEIIPALGTKKLGTLSRAEVQRFVKKLSARGLSGSSVRNILDPLRAIYREAISTGDVHAAPFDGLRLPAVNADPVEIVAVPVARELIAKSPAQDRCIWATAFYAGLRTGELQALRPEEVDLVARKINVTKTWDIKEGRVDPKSTAGLRPIPIIDELYPILSAHLAVLAPGSEFVFPSDAGDRPFWGDTVQDRADRAWSEAGLPRVTFRQCRHTFASIAIAAGLNVKALTTVMGHSSVVITIDRYGHLFPGGLAEAAKLINAFLRKN